MLIKEYLSMQETIDFVFELTGEKINHEILEELSNVNQLIPVFLFSGYVGCPVDGVTVYEKMKAYFTHDDFFMHKTRNYQSYSMYGDCDAPEWIEIHSPLTIQRILKQQMTIHEVFDEVFLFTQTPTPEIGKLDAIKLSTIDFDDVRFSRNELLGLFKAKKPYSNPQEEFDFYLGAMDKLRERAKPDNKPTVRNPIGNQRLLVGYALFTPHHITCLLSDRNPAYDQNDDEYNAYWDMVSNAIEAKVLTPINDKEQITAEQVKAWLAGCGFIYQGFNDNLTNDTSKTGQSNQQLIDAQAQIAQLATDYDKAQAKIAVLESQLIKADAALADTQSTAEQPQGFDKYNARKGSFIATGKAVARYLWSIDTTQAIRTGDMVQQIITIMHDVDASLLPDDAAIRVWLSDVAPDYAKKAGKTPNNAPKTIPLEMKR